MPVELIIPAVGESITEVEIGDWLKKEGDVVAQDEPVVVIETEKVTVELPAPAAGTITGVTKQKGDKANVGDVIGYVETAEKPADKSSEKTAAAAKRQVAGAAKAQAKPMPAPAKESAKEPEKETEKAQPAPRETPAPAPPPAPAVVHTATPVQTSAASSSREERAVAMTPIRRRIAERLVEAQNSAALLTTFNEVEMTAVMGLRKQYGEAFQAKYGIKLGFMSFFVKACIEALKLIPQLNAELRGQDIVYHNYHDMGIAIGGGRGLVVPVLRNAERLSFAEIEKAISDFAQRAQVNQLSVDELHGGTFTISNGGIYGSMLSTPIVNPPQSGVLGLHAIEDRPVARGGSVVVRSMMYVALTYDHRIVDGREAVTFLKCVKEVIEEPARMLLEV